jgi:hypothetical protein
VMCNVMSSYASARWAATRPGGGWGLAVVQRRGMVAWLRTRRDLATQPSARPAPCEGDASMPTRAADEIVRVLAGMALGALARG